MLPGAMASSAQDAWDRIPVGDDPGQQAWQLLMRLMMRPKPIWIERLAEFDLSPMHFGLLRQLYGGGAMKMSAIATDLRCDASNVTGLVDRLEGRSLIERRPAEHDRRVKMIALTDAGRSLCEEMMRRMWTPPPELAALPAEDLVALRDILARAVERGRQGTPQPSNSPS